ncbi:MAG: heme-binding domain-containing protein [bacterium]|nr:heme-binding domain-containing protein [bacterium]MDI1337128.1 heme-binding domain-containing protein [Lacunisphaera sp.]
MKRKLQLTGVILLALLLAIQFVPPALNVSAAASPNDIKVRHPVPANVAALLQRACYDCHSNNTHYPWYAAVQPVGWWLAWHVNDGRRHLDFSEFATYSAKRTKSKLGEIADEVETHGMPLRSYTWVHPEARLTPAEIKLIAAWAEGLQEELAAP